MYRKITTNELRDLLNDASCFVQKDIAKFNLSVEAYNAIDAICQRYHYVLSGIIEYLEQDQ